MLETYIERLEYKYRYSHGIIYDKIIFERNKIIRRDYTISERYFQGKRQQIEQEATLKAYNILDRYYQRKREQKIL